MGFGQVVVHQQGLCLRELTQCGGCSKEWCIDENLGWDQTRGKLFLLFRYAHFHFRTYLFEEPIVFFSRSQAIQSQSHHGYVEMHLH